MIRTGCLLFAVGARVRVAGVRGGQQVRRVHLMPLLASASLPLV